MTIDQQEKQLIHYRSFQGIGKDRFGERNQNGRTWVVPYVKGPDDAPLVKKARVVAPNAAPFIPTEI